MLRVLDLFSGIGGFSLGLERTGGFETVAFCEIDPFARRVLAKHWPEVPCHDDVSTVEFEPGSADIIVGGFPCQDVSLAGKRAGLAGARSGLYRELVRAIRVVRPRHAILENVAALLNDGMGTVLGDLAESGADAEWDCVPACAIGAPHERDRVWIVAHATDADRIDGRSGAGRKNGTEVGDGTPSRPPTEPADAPSLGCGQGRSGRPPDSFARVRDEARRNAADPIAARIRFAEAGGAIWTHEPPLSRVDDELPHWVDRTKTTGNAVLPKIPELIGRAILASTNSVHGDGE